MCRVPNGNALRACVHLFPLLRIEARGAAGFEEPLDLGGAPEKDAVQEHPTHALAVTSCVEGSKEGAIGGAHDAPACDAQKAADGLHIGQQVVCRVVAQPIGAARIATATLVDAHDSPQFWIEQARQIGRSRAARPSVQVDDGGAVRRAVLAHGQLVLGADGERVGREGLLSRVKARHWFLLDNSSKVNVRMCEPHVHCVPDPPAAY